MKLVNQFVEGEERFPLYCVYPSNCNAQKAYISLNLETGACDADYFAQTGSISFDQHNNIELTFPVSNQLLSGLIVDLIKEHADNFQFILDNSEVVDIQNGDRHGKLNDAAQKRFLDMLGAEEILGQHDSSFIIDDLGAYLDSETVPESNIYPEDGQSIDDYVKATFRCDGDNDYYFSDSLNSEQAIKDALTGYWFNELYCNEKLPKIIIVFLHSTGQVSDAWKNELEEILKEYEKDC